MSEPKRISLRQLKNNTGQLEALGVPKNPRFIKNEKFTKLCESLEKYPQFLEDRPVIAYDNGGELIVICGNMRLRAAKELKWKDIPCTVKPIDTDPEQLRALSVIDNANFGDWDIQELANWNEEELEAWGVDLPEWGAPEELNDEEEDLPIAPSEAKTNNDIKIRIPDEQADNRANIIEEISKVIAAYDGVTIK